MKHSVIPHKMTVNPDGKSLLIIDNHGSRFSTEAIDLCIANKIEVLCYPGHLTHILQGPDVVLNKPLKTNVDSMIQNNMLLTGNCMINRLNFINIIDNAMRETCSKELVLKAFSSTGVLPFDPTKIDLSQFPSSLANSTPVQESPLQATFSTFRKNDVVLHPLVKQGCVPKRLADVFAYSITPGKTRSRVKTVEKARIITSEEIRKEVHETEKRKRPGNKKKSSQPKATKTIKKKPKNRASKQAAKKSFKKLMYAPTDKEDSESDSDIDFVNKNKKRRKVVLENVSEEESDDESGDELGIEVDVDTGDEEVEGEIVQDDTIQGTSGHAVEIDMNEVTLGRWVKILYDGAWFLGVTTKKRLCPKTNIMNVRVRCFEIPIYDMDKPMELEVEGRSIWYEKIYDTYIVPDLVVVKRKHLYSI